MGLKPWVLALVLDVHIHSHTHILSGQVISEYFLAVYFDSVLILLWKDSADVPHMCLFALSPVPRTSWTD